MTDDKTHLGKFMSAAREDESHWDQRLKKTAKAKNAPEKPE